MSDDIDLGQDFARRLKDVFQLYVGAPHENKRFTREALADASGIGSSSLKGYIAGLHSLPAHALVRLLRVLPPEAGNMLIGGTGYQLRPIDCTGKDWLALAEKSASFAAKVIRYQATNGHIDHAEDADLVKDARELAAEATVA